MSTPSRLDFFKPRTFVCPACAKSVSHVNKHLDRECEKFEKVPITIEDDDECENILIDAKSRMEKVSEKVKNNSGNKKFSKSIVTIKKIKEQKIKAENNLTPCTDKKSLTLNREDKHAHSIECETKKVAAKNYTPLGRSSKRLKNIKTSEQCESETIPLKRTKSSRTSLKEKILDTEISDSSLKTSKCNETQSDKSDVCAKSDKKTEVVIICDSDNKTETNVNKLKISVNNKDILNDKKEKQSGSDRRKASVEKAHSIDFSVLKEKLASASNDNVKFDDVSNILSWRMELNPFRKFALNSLTKLDHLSSLKDGKILKSKNNNEFSLNEIEELKCENEMSKKEILNEPLITARGGSAKQETASNKREASSTENIESLNDQKANTEEELAEDGVNVPYFIQNILNIIATVITEKAYLFNADELRAAQKHNNLLPASFKLFVRLFQRKRTWFRCDKIKYPKIADDLTPFFRELVQAGYMENTMNLASLDETLVLLTAAETRQLANDFHLVKSTTSLSKSDLVARLKSHCSKQKSLFSFGNSSMTSLMLKKAKKLLGGCVKVDDEAHFLFTRIFTCFGATVVHYEDIMYNASHNMLFHLSQIDVKQVRSNYRVNSKHEIFQTRLDLYDYSRAVEMETRLDACLEQKDFEAALKIYRECDLRRLFLSIVDKENLERYSERPYFLHCFTSPWIRLRIFSKCVEVLEKHQLYDEAVNLAEFLLAQTFYRRNARGVLWERLVLDTERYLKNLPKAVWLIEEALKDPFVRTGYRLSLLRRYQRLKKSPRCKSIEFNYDDKITVAEPKLETLKGKIFVESALNQRAVFTLQTNGGEELSHVEEYVICHYKQHGFPHGIHGEGSTVFTLYMLLFWDVVFNHNVPDVFQTDYQSSPLDMYRDCFYESRRTDFDRRLDCVRKMDEETLMDTIRTSWDKHNGDKCVGVNWELFSSSQEVADLAMCLSTHVLCGISELFCKDYRGRRGGFPDIIVWNPNTKLCKIIEVKGPGDKLSTKQIVWLDVLTKLNADAFVCHVEASGGKRKRDALLKTK